MSLAKRVNEFLGRSTGFRIARVDRLAPWELTARAFSDYGQLSYEESRRLGELVRSSDPSRPLIEIGTLFGWSTLVMAMFKAPEQRLITVDNYSWNPFGIPRDAHLDVTSRRLQALRNSANVEQVVADKEEFYDRYEGRAPALVFLDADHSYESTKRDIEWATSVGATIICGDDYCETRFPGVVRAVDESGGLEELVDEFFVLWTDV